MNTQTNLSLYNLSTEYQRLLSQLYDHETGEINELIEIQLNSISNTTEQKCIAIASWIKNLEADRKKIELIKYEILKREAAFNKEIDKHFIYLQSNMQRCGITEIKNPLFTLRIKKNPYSTEIEDESKIPSRFMRTREILKTEIKADKNAIKEEVLNTGLQVPGAIVQQKIKLEILIDKI